MEYLEKRVFAIKFGSFLNIITAGFFSLGIVAGLIGATSSLLGGNASFTLGDKILTGPSAAIPFILLFPILFGLIGIIWGTFMFLPFKFFLKINKGILIKMITE